MVLEGSWSEEYCAGYATWEEAQAGHARTVSQLRGGTPLALETSPTRRRDVMRAIRRSALAVLAAVMVTGCGTMSSVIQEQRAGGGTTRVYPVSLDEAWKISIEIFRREGGGPIEEHKAEGYMLSEAGLNYYTGGTVMGAWFVPVQPTVTQVTVVTQRKMKTNIFTVLTEGTYHDRFAELVAARKAASK
jgi:hypothetical protein